MSDRDFALLEWRIKHILDWSAIDAPTKVLLQDIAKEVFTALRQSDKK